VIWLLKERELPGLMIAALPGVWGNTIAPRNLVRRKEDSPHGRSKPCRSQAGSYE